MSSQENNVKDVLMIVQTMGTCLPDDNDRFSFLAWELYQKTHAVEIVTSDFDHHKKSQRKVDQLKHNFPFMLTFLHEKPYQKNVSIKRIFSDLFFAFTLKSYLKRRKKPDVIYLSVPPLPSAFAVSKFAKKHAIKIVIDIQDLWPESFLIKLGNNSFGHAIIKPISFFANYIYKNADFVFAVSKTFLNRAISVRKNASNSACVYLGTSGQRVEKALAVKKISKPDDEFWIVYEGNFGISYDFFHIFKALHILLEGGIKNIKFILIGDGEQKETITKYIHSYFPNTELLGKLMYDEALQYIATCDLALNPVVKTSASTMVNKVVDYASCGVAVVNSQPTLEYRKIVDSFHIGLNAECENSDDIAAKILFLYQNRNALKRYGENNKKLFDLLFDRDTIYQPLVDAILK